MHCNRRNSPAAPATPSLFRINALARTVDGTQAADNIVLDDSSANVVVHARAGADMIRTGCGNDLIFGGSGADSVYAGSGDDIIYGGRGDDLVRGGEGNDVILGGEGMDNLFGGAGDDVLTGGKSFDLLMGDEGDDVFVFRRGDGSDTIFNALDLSARRRAGNDTIHFPDLCVDQLDSVRMEKEAGPGAADGRRLVVDYGQDDRVTIRYQEYQGHRAINTFRFADGSEWSASELLSVYSGKGGTLPRCREQGPALADALRQFHQSSSSCAGKVVGGEFLPGIAIPDKGIGTVMADASSASSTQQKARDTTHPLTHPFTHPFGA